MVMMNKVYTLDDLMNKFEEYLTRMEDILPTIWTGFSRDDNQTSAIKSKQIWLIERSPLEGWTECKGTERVLSMNIPKWLIRTNEWYNKCQENSEYNWVELVVASSTKSCHMKRKRKEIKSSLQKSRKVNRNSMRRKDKSMYEDMSTVEKKVKFCREFSFGLS